jgi:hypothetical protein
MHRDPKDLAARSSTALRPLVIEGTPSQGLNLFACIDLRKGRIKHVVRLFLDLGFPRVASVPIAPRKENGNQDQGRQDDGHRRDPRRPRRQRFSSTHLRIVCQQDVVARTDEVATVSSVLPGCSYQSLLTQVEVNSATRTCVIASLHLFEFDSRDSSPFGHRARRWSNESIEGAGR